MSSWLKPQYRPPPRRLGFYQNLPEGTFLPADAGEPPATVVTAYYPMKSKHDPEKYKEWISRFLRTLTCPIIFFTDAETLPFLESCPRASSSIDFVVLPRSEWKANDPVIFPFGSWDQQHAIDPERDIHSPELYKVWYEKKEFVMRAIERNPFGSTKFVWTDAGIMRYPEFEVLLKNRYPVVSRIPVDRMMVLNYTPFTPADENDLVINGGITIKGKGIDRPRIAAGVFAATINVWRKWNELYDDAIRRYKLAGLFYGKEQCICGTLALENKRLMSLLDLRNIAPHAWFYTLLYLSVPDRVWGILRSERAHREKWSYQRFVAECER